MSIKTYRSYSYAVFGPQKVGKTTIINRFINNEFKDVHNYTLEGQQITRLNVDGRIFEVKIHDTGGKINHKYIKHVWRANKDGFIFTFALNCLESFNKVLQEMEEIKSTRNYKNVVIVLVGNKNDLYFERKVDIETAKSQAQKYGGKYYEISAKDSKKEEIDRIFYQLIDSNQMNKFLQEDQTECRTSKAKSIIAEKQKVLWDPCGDSGCEIM